MKITCVWLRIQMPKTRARVVWTFGETIVTLVPTALFMKVDFPTFGAPTTAIKPAFFVILVVVLNLETEVEE